MSREHKRGMPPTQRTEATCEAAHQQISRGTQEDQANSQTVSTLKHNSQAKPAPSKCRDDNTSVSHLQVASFAALSLSLPRRPKPKPKPVPNLFLEKLQLKFSSQEPPVEEVKAQLLELLRRCLREQMPAREAEMTVNSFATGIIWPPITKKSLSELDIGAIIVNPKLRHDVNFDRELHFRPNLDGDRGKEKVKDAERYWAALVAELTLYSKLFDRSHAPVHGPLWRSIVKASQRRIPSLFEMLRDILKHLVPERDQKRVEERLDKDLLMQQIENGVCDLLGLSLWLAELLKAHCAPMRDEWVDRMVKQMQAGVEAASAKSIVDGLKELFGILEAMKLDVANHQIRHLRTLLIEDTINFETKYQLTRISNPRKLDVETCVNWFTEAKKQARLRASPSDTTEGSKLRRAHPEFVVFLEAILQHLLSNDPTISLPPSLYLDVDRLRACKSDLFDLVAFDICHQVFQWTAARVSTPGIAPQLNAPAIQSLRDTLNVVVTEGSTNPSKHWVKNISNLSVEIVRQAQTSCRVPKQTDVSLIKEVEGWLGDCFSSIPVHAAKVERELLPGLFATAEKHIGSSPVDLFGALISHTGPPPPPLPPAPARLLNKSKTPLPPPMSSLTPEPMQVGPHAAITRKIAHILILHWKIWSELLYLRPNEQADSPSRPGRGRRLTLGDSTSSTECNEAVDDESTRANDNQLSAASADANSDSTGESAARQTVQDDEDNEPGAPTATANDAQPATWS